MGVQLNIKSAEARALAERVASVTGESITDAVTKALKARLHELELDRESRGRARTRHEAGFYALIAGSRERWRGTLLATDHGDLLYDEVGLPR